MNDSTEVIGYMATFILVLSFLPRNIKYIRSINFFACVLFVVYGILLGFKWPIILSNGAIALIQLYYLYFSRKTSDIK
ncbi:MAG TPA: uroporphyrinogen decarboxylase [Niabella sp.]|nr:uroporphyrinogen decarboxylase [Niabella sp.]